MSENSQKFVALGRVDTDLVKRAADRLPSAARDRFFAEVLAEHERGLAEKVRVRDLYNRSSYLGRTIEIGYMRGKLTDIAWIGSEEIYHVVIDGRITGAQYNVEALVFKDETPRMGPFLGNVTYEPRCQVRRVDVEGDGPSGQCIKTAQAHHIHIFEEARRVTTPAYLYNEISKVKGRVVEIFGKKGVLTDAWCMPSKGGLHILVVDGQMVGCDGGDVAYLHN